MRLHGQPLLAELSDGGLTMSRVNPGTLGGIHRVLLRPFLRRVFRGEAALGVGFPVGATVLHTPGVAALSAGEAYLVMAAMLFLGVPFSWYLVER